jgi:hypothetical protein
MEHISTQSDDTRQKTPSPVPDQLAQQGDK